jgi:hypothetical protein
MHHRKYHMCVQEHSSLALKDPISSSTTIAQRGHAAAKSACFAESSKLHHKSVRCCGCRYNELQLAGTTKSAPAALGGVQAYLDAQDDAATRHFKVHIDWQYRSNMCGCNAACI